MKRYVGIVLSLIICLFSFTACSSAKGDVLSIYSQEYSEEYKAAAKKHFPNVLWSNGNYLNDNLDEPVKVGLVNYDPPRYVVVISEKKGILNREPIEGKRYTVFVHDNGSDDITMLIIYKVGTTDDCVIQGNVTSGEMAYKNTLYIEASEVTDPAQRAALIFDDLKEALTIIETK